MWKRVFESGTFNPFLFEQGMSNEMWTTVRLIIERANVKALCKLMQCSKRLRAYVYCGYYLTDAIARERGFYNTSLKWNRESDALFGTYVRHIEDGNYIQETIGLQIYELQPRVINLEVRPIEITKA